MIKIVTDSSSYFKKAEAVQLGIKVVPINYTIGHQNYFETYSDQNGDFENAIKNNSDFATSQPNMSAFLSSFEEELVQGNQVLCITIASRLSGAYGTAYMAAKMTENKNIVVFDSQLTGGGLYLLINEAVKLINEGKDIEAIVKELIMIREKITVAFSVDDMTPLRNSGRIGFVRMNVSTILNIRPILLCKEGVVVADGIAHGSVDMVKKLVAKIDDSVKKVVINYIENTRMATNIYNVIKEKYPNIELKLQKVGPVLGIHLGLSAIGVSFIRK